MSIFKFLLPIIFFGMSEVVISGDTLPRKEAEKFGVRKCLGTVDKVSDFLIKKSAHGVDSTWNKASPDNRLFSFFVSREYSDGDSHVTMSFAPNASGGCDFVYVQTFVLEKACSIVREEQYGQLKFRASLNSKTLVLTGKNEGLDIYLTPSGKKSDSCLVSIRESVYLD